MTGNIIPFNPPCKWLEIKYSSVFYSYDKNKELIEAILSWGRCYLRQDESTPFEQTLRFVVLAADIDKITKGLDIWKLHYTVQDMLLETG
jgi:hypothetical protein